MSATADEFLSQTAKIKDENAEVRRAAARALGNLR